jgi:hypothetical protein
VPLLRRVRCALGIHQWWWACYRNAYGDEHVERGVCQACGAVLTALPPWGVWALTAREACDGWTIYANGSEVPAMRKD